MPTSRTAAALLAAGLLLSACGASGGSDETTDATATTSAETTTAKGQTTTEAPAAETTSTTEGDAMTPVDGLPPCQELLEQYASAFTPDDLSPVIELFRTWAPYMPDDVATATNNLADAYEDADAKLANIDMNDVDLTADAQVFSDWTNDGCPSA